MLSLRLWLLLIGLVFIAGVYLWGSSQRRRHRQATTSREYSQLHTRAPMMLAEPEELDTIDTELDRPERSQEEVGEHAVISPMADDDLEPALGVTLSSTVVEQANREQLPLFKAAAPRSEIHGTLNELIIVVYVETDSNAQAAQISGPSLLTALQEVGMRYGEMRIFHHYGIGEVQSQAPVFSLANMVEPGSFDIDAMEEFNSQGLALFLKLPLAQGQVSGGQTDGLVAFELMLNTAQRLAEVIGASLNDDDHQPLDAPTIASIRDSIAQFEYERG